MQIYEFTTVLSTDGLFMFVFAFMSSECNGMKIVFTIKGTKDGGSDVVDNNLTGGP